VARKPNSRVGSMKPTSYFCSYIPGDAACVTCPLVENCPKRSKITPIFGAVARTFIKPCKKQPTTCSIKFCFEYCEALENENLFLMALRRV